MIPENRKNLLYIVIVIINSVFIIFAFFNFKQLNNMNFKVSSLREEILKYQKTRSTIKNFNESEASYEEMRLKIKLPVDHLIPLDVFKKIIELAKKTGIKEMKISQLQGVEKLSVASSEVAAISFKTEMETDYEKVTFFLKELAGFPCLVNISSLKITRKKEDITVFNIVLTLDTYTLLEKEKITTTAMNKLKSFFPKGIEERKIIRKEDE